MTLQLEDACVQASVPCPACGAALLRTGDGELCTACLLLPALSDSEERVGPYALISELDAGGSGTVYMAKHVDHDGLVAIKLAKADVVATAEGLAAFRSGLRIQKSLRHLPNILSVDDLGTHPDGRPFAVMSLLAGGTLADAALQARYTDPVRVVELMIKLSRAVARAHERGVLHGDLKPANVLFDEDGEAFVSDFGMARIVGGVDARYGATFQGGTVGWMSPEQAQRAELTLASDVFNLGMLLYWLLTRELPFGQGRDFLARVVHDPAPLLSRRYRGAYAWELEQICARALHKDPEQRYRSAADLADDLECARTMNAIQSETRRPVRRAFKWMRRHKLAALAGIELCMLLLYLPWMPISVVRELKSTVRNQISFSALAQAGAVMNDLRRTAHRLEQLALDPEIRRLVREHDDPSRIPVTLGLRAAGTDGISLFSAAGMLKARWPEPRARQPPLLDFSFRDYFQGQLRLARAGRRDVYVARPFHSTGDNEPMLGLSTPLYDEHDRYLGALVSRTRARATFGSVRMDCGGQGSCMSALLGPRDRDRAGQALPDAIFVLAAPGMTDGQELMIEPALAHRICAQLDCQPQAFDQFEPPTREQPLLLDDYLDPISHARSMAALAPVGRTGLIVVVATTNDALDAVTQRMTERLKAFVWVPVLLGLCFLGIVLAYPWLRAKLK